MPMQRGQIIWTRPTLDRFNDLCFVKLSKVLSLFDLEVKDQVNEENFIKP